MRELSCDVAIIGAGTAGLAARAAASRAGAKTLLIEAGPGGTTCARVGCMPSKLILAAADAAARTRGLDLFGLSLAEPVRVDGRAVLERVRRERDRFVGSVLEDIDRIPAGEKVSGRARFAGPTTLLVDDHTRIAARAIVVATGSAASVPEELDGVHDLVLTNETLFEIEDLPSSLAVVGAGPLGLELAQAFARLGVRVAVFDKGSSIGGLKDPAVSEAARAIVGQELDLRLETSFTAARDEGGVRLAWQAKDGRSGTDAFARVLAAAGRLPRLGGLDLDRAGLALDDKGVPVFDRATLRCGESAIFIAGDADGDRPVLHEASLEGTIAGRNAATHPDVTPSRRDVSLAIVYTDPEMASVGPSWTTLKDEGPAIAEVNLAESGRARIAGENRGLLRLYARPSDGRLLGAEMVGPQVEHLAHLVAWAVQAEMDVDTILGLPFYHPSLEESLRAAVRKLRDKVRTAPTPDDGGAEFFGAGA